MASTKYMFDTAEEGERDRLLAHALMWDPVTRRRLGGIGVTEGWRCLEVGAGSGTVTRWLAGQVGGSGHVVATDIQPRWLRSLDAPNVEVLRHDVTTDPLGESVYDLICARLVLTHLPDPLATVGKLLRALVPGGWLLVEEYDLRSLPLCDPPDATWHKVAAAPSEILRLGGGDPELGAKLTGILHAAGAAEIDTEAVALPRRMPEVLSWQAQFVQFRERLIDAGLVSPAEVDKVIADFDDDTCDLVVHGPTLVSARGRKGD
ncbi:class I SAM-dependent methyltransferase [Amycolatopsis sp. YIM 10]|uniref:class I SAM-dependent methyltransferase n=1 Tax=Amycolatopsis sp. YIM 10 TaxID=2653857 RepID=UPI0012905C6C|nr:methyltransferase domain-containing protein [Amycolatopsis sp. YIM 10]QFU89860.1 Demethylmenaquinone methyltransferase [Amycolatopsis sp. YIM 10]